MANETETKAAKKPREPKATTPKPLNLDEKVTIRNISDHDVGFARLTEMGYVQVVSEGRARISRNEIIAQVNNENNLLSGVDGRGSHATLYIEDEPTRIELGFDSEDGSVKQKILSDEVIKELFAIKNQKEFEERFKETIVTRAESFAIMQSIKRLNLSDYYKIRYIEEQTGRRLF